MSGESVRRRLRYFTTHVLLFVATPLTYISAHQGSSRAPTFTRAFALRPDEGVFAYSRISPNGQQLAYASERPSSQNPDRIERHVTIVDLRSGKTIFSERGIDAYWSVNGTRIIYLSHADGASSVSIREASTGSIWRDIAPSNLGDYYSWSFRDGKDLILTIKGNYYALRNQRAVLPYKTIPECPGLGRGERPLVSKNGRRVSVFVRGELVIRELDSCNEVVHTHVRGAKADLSFDNRYLAFHALRPRTRNYDIQVIDLERRTIRTVTNLEGSSLFPSWTQDGRLSFRYDGPDYRGFIVAGNVLSAPEQPLPESFSSSATVSWEEVFPETPRPRTEAAVVTIWSTWSAHSEDALKASAEVARSLRAQNLSATVLTALEPASQMSDARRIRSRLSQPGGDIPLAPHRLHLTDADNQIPTTILFVKGRMVGRKLGAQSADAIGAWVLSFTSRATPNESIE